MQVKMSNHLIEIKPQIKRLISLLEKAFDYVSVLSTDVCGTSYRVVIRQKRLGAKLCICRRHDGSCGKWE